MLRSVKNGWRFVTVTLALVLLFFVLHAFVPVPILILILNGLFFGTFVSIATAYGPMLLQTLFGSAPYSREFHYSLSVVMQWTVMLAVLSMSVWFRITDQSNAVNDSAIAAGIAYLSIVAIIWQGLTLTQGADHDRNVLFWSIAAGGVVAAVLVLLQAWGTGWIEIPPWLG